MNKKFILNSAVIFCISISQLYSQYEVIDAFLILTRTEGIIPALESAHAIAYAIKISKKMKKTESIVVTLSGRGDKDIDIVQEYLEKK